MGRSVTTALKGNATEAMVLTAFVERDFAVLVPFGEGHPYDLVVHVAAEHFLRIQCKTARLRNGCVMFNSRSPQTTARDKARIVALRIYSACIVHLLAGSTSFPLRRSRPPWSMFAEDYEIGSWTAASLLEVALPGSLGSIHELAA